MTCLYATERIIKIVSPVFGRKKLLENILYTLIRCLQLWFECAIEF